MSFDKILRDLVGFAVVCVSEGLKGRDGFKLVVVD